MAVNMLSHRGFTLVELLVASVVTSVIAGGTFMAISTAARLSTNQASPQVGEAMGFAQETVEKPRNHVAVDDTWFNDNADGVWHDEPLPVAATGTESINQPPANAAERRYCVVPEDCDGVDGVGDCFRVEVQVCWNGTFCHATTDPCP